MKRFEYPLERVRRWRREQADIEELRLRQLLAELRATEESCERVRTERERAEAALLSKQTTSGQELSLLDSFRRHTLLQRRMLEELCRAQKGKIAAQRDRVIEARRRFELMERLYQKAYLEWQAAFNKEQEDLASELFLAKVGRGT